MKNVRLLSFILFMLYFIQITVAMPNPWVECDNSLSCGAKKAGFEFPLDVKNYTVRAMQGLFEIEYPLDKKRNVIVRKTNVYDGNDISGVYESFPINKAITMNDGSIVNIKGNKKKYYVANFATKAGYYSAYCGMGMSQKDIKKIYKLIVSTEKSKK